MSATVSTMNEPPADSSVRFSRYVIRLSSTVSYRRLVEDALQDAAESGRPEFKLESMSGSTRLPQGSVHQTKLRLHRSKSQGQSWCWDPRVLVDRTGLRTPRYHADHASILPNTYVAPDSMSVNRWTGQLENLARVELDLGLCLSIGKQRVRDSQFT